MSSLKSGGIAIAGEMVSLDRSLSDRLVQLLVKCGAKKRSAEIFVDLRGIGGSDPMTLRGLGRGLSGERVRQIVRSVELEPLRAAIKSPDAETLRSDVSELVQKIGVYAPGSDLTVKDAMLAAGLSLQSPASVIRLADVIGCTHDLRLTNWVWRSKYSDEQKTQLASHADRKRLDSVTSIVPIDMPEVFDSFMNFSRKFSRGAGVISCEAAANLYSRERGVPLSHADAYAFLIPFAAHLGRYDGDDWFIFCNTANDFLRKTKNRVDLLGSCSFDHLLDFHRKYNRSLFSEEGKSVPEEVLKKAIALAGYSISGDAITKSRGAVQMDHGGRGVSEVQSKMVDVFKQMTGSGRSQRSVSKSAFMGALRQAGINETTSTIYLANKCLFKCQRDKCQLADASLLAEDVGNSSV